jgi:hypothetical protein
MRYVGTKPLSAYVLKIEFANAKTGKTIHTSSVSSSFGLNAPIAPGTLLGTPADNIPLDRSGNPASYKVTVDLLIYSDGTRSGPETLRESHELIGEYRARISDARAAAKK